MKHLPPAPRLNIIERAIESIAPQWALSRHRARVSMAVGGGYVGAGYSERFANWQPGVQDADSDTIRDLRELRGRSRDLVRNSPIGAGAIETDATHVVGSGLTLQCHVDAELLGLTEEQANAWQRRTERRFKLWAESTYSDALDELTFAEQQDLAYRSGRESGDAGVVLSRVKRPGWPFTLAVQLIEADRICNPNFGPDTEAIVSGIERDQAGAPVAAHICDRHPSGGSIGGRPRGSATWRRVEFRGSSGRRNFILLKRKLRPGQTRGIPALAPIIATLKQMSRYSDAEIDAAVNSAAQAVFVKMDPESFQDLFDADEQDAVFDAAKRWDGSLKAGRAVNLLPGESIESPSLGRPNPNFDPFMSAFMRYLGIGLNIPNEVLSKHFQASYSAARAALLDAWRTFLIRRKWFASKFCQPIYEEWLADEVASGRIGAPGFFADAELRAAWCGSSWSGDGPGALDPEKEANAAEKRMTIGLTNLAEETVAYDGGDWEAKHRQRAREVKVRVQDGLQTSPSAPPPAPVAVPGVPKRSDQEDPEADDDDAEGPRPSST